MGLPADFQEKLKALQVMYLKDLPQKLDELQAAFIEADGDHAALLKPQRMAHSLAGSGATFGVVAVSTVARKLENRIVDWRESRHPITDEIVGEVLLAIDEMRLSCGVSNEAPPAPVKQDVPVDVGPRKHICLVEDDPLIAEDLRAQLGYFGYQIHHYSSPKDLLAQGLPADTEAILCDVAFPEGDSAGTDTVKSLSDTICAGIPVMFVSSRDDIDARLQAVRAGGRAYLTKPVDMTALVTQLDQLTSDGKRRPVRVLIVDDSPAFAKFYADVLEQSGMVTHSLTDPLRIGEGLSGFQPDLILLDMYMPTCTGVELARVIRQQEAFVSIPIVYLSSESNITRQLEAMQSGADDFLQKPIEPHHLVASIRARTDRHAQLRSFIVRDSLTNLLNHSHLRESLDVELSRAMRAGRSVSFAMIDIDNFKSVNDKYGHPTGDQVLRALARMLGQRLRKTDIAGRYGGEEFGVVLSDTDTATAVRVLDVLREDFSQIRHVVDGNEFRVTFSAGVAEFPGLRSVEALTRAADVALYEAKRKGRNRIEASLALRG